jgi:tRNA 2-thiouridine synthesizing protein A
MDDQPLDLTGEVCPYTFVKTKLALEELSPGDILRVFVDNVGASKNVPKSAAREGHTVLSIVQEEKGWMITIQCKA